jgi:hypothetical protein
MAFKVIRVTMQMDVHISADTPEEEEYQVVCDTLERILEEGEPYIGEGGIEIKGMEFVEEYE